MTSTIGSALATAQRMRYRVHSFSANVRLATHVTLSASFTNLELLLNGTYTIVLRELGGDATGDYSLTAVVADANVDADAPFLNGGVYLRQRQLVA